MKAAVVVIVGFACLCLTADFAEARSLPEWDFEGQCNSMSTEDNVADDPLFQACMEREQKALESLKVNLDEIPEEQWAQCIDVGKLQKSYMLLMECLQDMPEGALPATGSSE